MGKKGKKKADGSAKGKKKKGGKKGKKAGEPQMTWKEALLGYQINIKEKQMEDIRYELRALEEKNLRHKERNERLREEQSVHIKNMLKQAEEIDKKLAEEDVITKEQVIATMMENWESERSENQSIADLKAQIARKESEIIIEEKQVDYWKQYQVRGQVDHSKQILLLEQELVDMQNTFDEMASHLERTLELAKSEITSKTKDTLEKQKFIATEKAMAKMDKYSRQEVLDNDWLRREVEMHQKEVGQLLVEVESLEKKNLAMMGDLFECQVDDLRISRDFFLTQFKDGENLDETGLLEMDLGNIDFKRYASKLTKGIDEIEAKPHDENEENDEQEYDPFDSHLHFDDEDFDDYLQLGPLELKLLSISGRQMPITQREPSDMFEGAEDQVNGKWPVTGPMIQNTLKGSARA